MSVFQHHLVIGVTGHRDIPPEAVGKLAAKVEEILDDIDRLFSVDTEHTDYVSPPKTLISPLADGADRIVASAALKRGYRLVVPMPMPQAEYEKDFTAPASLTEFRQLLAKAAASFVVPLALGATPNYREAATRTVCYVTLAHFMSASSQVLICLYDGNVISLRGGSSHVAALKVTGAEPYLGIDVNMARWQLPDYGLVYHLITPRIQAAMPPKGELFTYTVTGTNAEPDPGKATDRLRQIHRYIAQYEKETMPCGAGEPYASAGEHQTGHYTSLFDRADAIASHYQNHTLKALMAIFVSALAAAFFGGAYSDMSNVFPCPSRWTERWKELAHHDQVNTNNPLLLLAFLLTLGFACGVFWLSRRRLVQDKYQDIRALAEGLRVQRFWNAAGILYPVTDYYLEKQRSLLDWIRATLRGYHLEALCQFSGSVRPDENYHDAKARILQVESEWVEDQARYFQRKADVQYAKLEHHELIAKVLFGTGVGIAVLMLGLYCSLALAGSASEARFICSKWTDIPFSLMGLLPVLGGLVKYRIDKLGWAEHVLLYRQMARIFENAKQRLAELNDDHTANILSSEQYLSAARKILLDLGAAALAENADWLVMHRFKAVELPT